MVQTVLLSREVISGATETFSIILVSRLPNFDKFGTKSRKNGAISSRVKQLNIIEGIFVNILRVGPRTWCSPGEVHLSKQTVDSSFKGRVMTTVTTEARKAVSSSIKMLNRGPENSGAYRRLAKKC